MTIDDVVDDAVPAQHFNKNSFRAECFRKDIDLSGVMNRDGVNCLTFKSKPGAVLTNMETAQRIAEKWNAA